MLNCIKMDEFLFMGCALMEYIWPDFVELRNVYRVPRKVSRCSRVKENMTSVSKITFSRYHISWTLLRIYRVSDFSFL